MKEGILYFDGGIRNGICAYGWLLCNPENEEQIIAQGNKTCGTGTSNIAEYRALIAGLQGALDCNIDQIFIVGDSQLVVKQITGAFKTNKPDLMQHRDRALDLLGKFKTYTIKWVPRHKNKRADTLVNEVFERKSGKCRKTKNK